jgi:hypothetical protein
LTRYMVTGGVKLLDRERNTRAEWRARAFSFQKGEAVGGGATLR